MKPSCIDLLFAKKATIIMVKATPYTKWNIINRNRMIYRYRYMKAEIIIGQRVKPAQVAISTRGFRMTPVAGIRKEGVALTKAVYFSESPNATTPLLPTS